MSGRIVFATRAMCQQFVAPTQKRWPQVFSRQCLLHRYSHNLCPPVESEEARDVRQGFAPLWKVLNARLRSDCKGTDDIVPPIDVLSPTLTVADKNPTVLLVYHFAAAGQEHLYALVLKAYVSRRKLLAKPVLKPKTRGCHRVMAVLSPLCRMSTRGALWCLAALFWWFVLAAMVLTVATIILPRSARIFRKQSKPSGKECSISRR